MMTSVTTIIINRISRCDRCMLKIFILSVTSCHIRQEICAKLYIHKTLTILMHSCTN